MTEISASRVVDAPATVVWDVVTDHDLYAEVAPNLATVEVLDGEGVGMVRRCVDTDGNEWTESCTRWDDGRGFAVAVDVEHSEFHRHLFDRFEGEWSVSERPDGVVVTIRFDFEPRYGPFGALVSWYVERRASPILDAILDRWADEATSRLRSTSPTAGDPGGARRDPDPGRGSHPW
jgi:ribosome-associated toxin RatA of RatAB toxin-antitoxin module